MKAGLFDSVRDRLGREALPSPRAEASDGEGPRFEVGATLGGGAQAEVRGGTDRLLGREVALKLWPELDSPEEALHEARALARFDHSGIVGVHDLVVLPDEGRPAMVSKRVRGLSLDEALAPFADRPLELPIVFDLVTVAIRLCEALAHAHAVGVLHCDLKPANVMIGGFGEVFLVDWGASIVRGSRAPRPNPLHGTFGFMAPEQFDLPADALDCRVDVHALGALLLHAVTMGSPLDQSHPYGLGHQHDSWAHRRSGLEAIINRALEPDRKARLSNADELRKLLVRWQMGQDISPMRKVQPGELIVREGDLGDCAFLIERGRCEVLQTRRGVERVIGEMGVGEVFGELALFGDGNRTASVRAVEPTQLQVLDRATVMGALSETRPWLSNLLEGLAGRFIRAEERLERDDDHES